MSRLILLILIKILLATRRFFYKNSLFTSLLKQQQPENRRIVIRRLKQYNKPIRDGGFKRGLKDRHVQLIALGGIIGSCYFLGTGEVIHLVGPSVFLAYLLGGVIIYLTML